MQNNRKLGVALAALGLVLMIVSASVGLSVWLVEADSSGLHADGREVEQTTVADPVDEQTKSDQQFATRQSLSRYGLMALAKRPQYYTFKSPLGDVQCRDVTDEIPSNNAPNSWERRRSIKYVAIHSTGAETDPSAMTLASYHVGTLGWEHEAYSVNVRKSGECEKMLPDGVMDYAAFHYNTISYNIHLAGLVKFTSKQLDTARKIVVGIAIAEGLDETAIVGHRTFSQMDARDRANGVYHQNYNDHVDPCLSANSCEFDRTFFGFREALRNVVGTEPPPKFTGYRPRIPADVTTIEGSATFYSEDFRNKPMRCPNPIGPEIPKGKPWPTFNPDDAHITAVYVLGDGEPALPCGTWLRVYNLANNERVDVKVTDTGKFDYDDPAHPKHILDLSRAASERLRASVAANIPRIRAEIISRDDNFCRYVAESNYRVCGDFRQSYFPPYGRGHVAYGFPVEDANYSRWTSEKLVTQRFQYALFSWRNGVTTIEPRRR